MRIAYKLFRVSKTNKGKLYPLFVNSNIDIPLGVWVQAEEGEQLENGKVKSKLGPLCFRPGWHLSDIPLAIHIGMKDESGKIAYMKPNYVWCECEYKDDINYQEEANKNGIINEKFTPKFAYLKKIPKNGYYRYKTSQNMLGEWIISGEIKINKVLSDLEVAQILIQNNYPVMPRKGGEINLAMYGF